MFSKNWLSKSRDIHVFSHQGEAKKFCLFSVVKMVQLYKNFTLDFWPYLSNAVELRHGSCAKTISTIRRLQSRPQWLAMTIIKYFDTGTLIFCLYSFILDVWFAGTSITLSNICLMALCTIWHEKVNGGGFHSKGTHRKPQLHL